MLRLSKDLRIRATAILALMFAISGCTTMSPHAPLWKPNPSTPIYHEMPKELSKTSLPRYIIEPPDMLSIEALHVVPKPPYLLRTGDVLSLQAQGTLPDAPVAGPFAIEPGGNLNLGVPYGSVKVTGMTVDNAQKKILLQLKKFLQQPLVAVALLQMAGQQQIGGNHLVGPDGRVTLGSYGSVSVVGMTVAQATKAIEKHLSKTLENPKIAVDVVGYNSKVYYIVTEGAGLGDGVSKFPVTGNETVLDAIANINGLTQVSSKRIWIARPSPYKEEVQVLPIDWKAVTAGASTATNYQILPGDRIFIAEDRLIAFDTGLGKLLAPIERLSGFTLLGVGTASRLSGKVIQNRQNFGGFGFTP